MPSPYSRRVFPDARAKKKTPKASLLKPVTWSSTAPAYGPAASLF
jgi:hypothetical protein